MIERFSRRVVYYNMPKGGGDQYPVASCVGVDENGEFFHAKGQYHIYSQEVDADNRWHLNEMYGSPISSIKFGYKAGLNEEALIAVLIERCRDMQNPVDESKCSCITPDTPETSERVERLRECEAHLVKAMEALTGKPFRDETHFYKLKKQEKATE